MGYVQEAFGGYTDACRLFVGDFFMMATGFVLPFGCCSAGLHLGMFGFHLCACHNAWYGQKKNEAEVSQKTANTNLSGP